MGANNIVVIIKGISGKFRAYHRDYGAYIEGRYKNIPEEELDSGVLSTIFEADSCEEAILKYDKWLDSMDDGKCQIPFTVEYGYVFEGLVPNKLTVETLEKSERGEEVHKTSNIDEVDKVLFQLKNLKRNKMTVKELIEKLKLAPEEVEVFRGDSNRDGDLTETPVDKVEIILDNQGNSVTIY